jgi:hypothetical protein
MEPPTLIFEAARAPKTMAFPPIEAAFTSRFSAIFREPATLNLSEKDAFLALKEPAALTDGLVSSPVQSIDPAALSFDALKDDCALIDPAVDIAPSTTTVSESAARSDMLDARLRLPLS